MSATPPERMDRRTNRSDDPLVALTELLESTRRARSIEVLAIADLSGCLVAGAGAAERCEELAALAPIAERATAKRRSSRRRPSAQQTSTFYRRLRFQGLEVYLCAESRTGSATSEGLEHAGAGCQRILTARAP